MRFTIYADGGSRGNPGPAGAGAVVYDESETIVAEVSEYLGHTTNNVAEYTALVRALEVLERLTLGETRTVDVQVRMDSELVVKQLTGVYNIKHPNLKPLAAKAKELARTFRSISFTHVYREQNKVADALANKAMDAGA